MRGVFRRRSCKAERGVASRRCGANRGTGRSGTSSESGGNAGNGNVRRAAAGLKRACPPKLQRRQGPGRQTPRCCAERRACVSRSKRNVRAAPHPRGSLAPQGATKTRRCASRRSARPSIRGRHKRKGDHPRAKARRKRKSIAGCGDGEGSDPIGSCATRHARA
jgi:hypothetical protein